MRVSPFLLYRKYRVTLKCEGCAPYRAKPCRAGCAPRGEEVNASHTARARKCAAGAHFILKHNKIKEEQ